MLKKYWPLLVLVVGIIVVVVAVVIVSRGRGGSIGDEDLFIPEVPVEQRPFTSLTPTEDGRWLNLKIENIVIDAASMDYELLYKVEDGRTQGVPGTIELNGQAQIERDLLLGSESSGKFRYDEGVEDGTLTLRFRNDRGKLTGKLSTDFHLQSGVKELTSIDGKFSYTLASSSDDFFVTMSTFGLPAESPGELVAGPYGVFSASTKTNRGTVELGTGDYYRFSSGDWKALSDKSSPGIGTFVSTASE